MEAYRYSTGVDFIDRALNGGFSGGSLVLLEYDTGSPKNIFIKEFLKSGLKEREQIYAVLTDGKISSIFDENELQGFSKNNFVVVDGFTNAFEWSEVKPDVDHRIDDISSIKKVHEVLRKAVEPFDNKKTTRGLIDSLSTLFMAENYSDLKQRQNPSLIPKYLLHQSVMCKSVGSVLMCTLHQGTQDESFERMIENISDYVLRLKTKETEEGYENYLSILTAKNYNRPSLKYKIALDNEKLVASGA